MERVKVKILGLSFDHKVGGETAWLVQYALKAAQKFGRRVSQVAEVETVLIELADKKIRQCLGCGKRWEMTDRGCIIRNDYVTKELVPKLGEADGLIYGTLTSGLTVTSTYRMVVERFGAALWKGYMTNKPTAGLVVEAWPLGGQEVCLDEILRTSGAENIPLTWLGGAYSIRGGANRGGPDGATGIKQDAYAKWLAVFSGRRVAEFALMVKLAKQELGELYFKEFMQVYHPHYGKYSWDWHRLDKEDDEFMQALETPKKARLSLKRAAR